MRWSAAPSPLDQQDPSVRQEASVDFRFAGELASRPNVGRNFSRNIQGFRHAEMVGVQGAVTGQAARAGPAPRALVRPGADLPHVASARTSGGAFNRNYIFSASFAIPARALGGDFTGASFVFVIVLQNH